MKAADIDDELFLRAVRESVDYHHDVSPYGWRARWTVQETLEKLMGCRLPEKVFLAKARRLIRRGVLHGCDCSCRGDYHLPGRESCC